MYVNYYVVYVSSMKQPEIGSINSEYKSTPLNIRENNDF